MILTLLPLLPSLLDLKVAAQARRSKPVHSYDRLHGRPGWCSLLHRFTSGDSSRSTRGGGSGSGSGGGGGGGGGGGSRHRKRNRWGRGSRRRSEGCGRDVVAVEESRGLCQDEGRLGLHVHIVPGKVVRQVRLNDDGKRGKEQKSKRATWCGREGKERAGFQVVFCVARRKRGAGAVGGGGGEDGAARRGAPFLLLLYLGTVDPKPEPLRVHFFFQVNETSTWCDSGVTRLRGSPSYDRHEPEGS